VLVSDFRIVTERAASQALLRFDSAVTEEQRDRGVADVLRLEARA
jgi:hypothetical protein